MCVKLKDGSKNQEKKIISEPDKILGCIIISKDAKDMLGKFTTTQNAFLRTCLPTQA